MIKSSQFNKSGACSSRSSFVENSKASRQLDEAIIIKDFMKDILSENCTIPKLSDLIDEVAAAYSDETLDDIDETQESYAKTLAKQIWRCGKSMLNEHLQADDKVIIPEDPFIIDLSEKVENDFPDSDEISVGIDAIIYNSVKKTLQAIVFKRGVPKIGKTASAYRCVENDIPLHFMMYAMERFADDLLGDNGGSMTITTSYYYMKKSDDKNDKAMFANYYDGSSPVREMSGLYTKGAPSKFDVELLDLVNTWAKGFDKCDMKEAEDCEGCPDYCMCYYSLAPMPVETSGEKKKRAKCTPTEEQQAIINAREGVYLCNAVPGSGKTETAIKQRTVSIILDELDIICKKAEAGEDISEYLTPANTYLTKDSRRVDPELFE